MGKAEVVSLVVKPVSVSRLCFERDGILERVRVQLGASVEPFGFEEFHEVLSRSEIAKDREGRLRFDAAAIREFLERYHILGELRSVHDAGIALQKAINARQNSYLSKYRNLGLIDLKMHELYHPHTSGSKSERLAALSGLASGMWDQVRAAYEEDERRSGVVRTSDSQSTSTSEASSEGTRGTTWTTPGRSWPDKPGTPEMFRTVPSNPKFLQENGETELLLARTSQQQSTRTDLPVFTVPSLEAAAQHERSQISLMDEQFEHFMSIQNLPFLGEIFENELNSIDCDVHRLQALFLGSFLLPAVGGTVTAIYKNPGEEVKAGEPVVRIEDDHEVYIVGSLICHEQISIGSKVEIETERFKSPSPKTKVTGRVDAVRGRQDDEHWEVIIRFDANHPSGKNPVFPLGYKFDRQRTSVSVSAS